MGRAQNIVKRGIFWPYRVGRRQGRRPLSPTEKREPPTARTRPGGPWPDFKRLRATAGQGPNYVGPACGYVGLCWPILRAMWGRVAVYITWMIPTNSSIGRSFTTCGLKQHFHSSLDLMMRQAVGSAADTHRRLV